MGSLNGYCLVRHYPAARVAQPVEGLTMIKDGQVTFAWVNNSPFCGKRNRVRSVVLFPSRAAFWLINF
jgi:hypothetical protein